MVPKACPRPRSGMGTGFRIRPCAKETRWGLMRIDVSFLPAYAAAFMLLFARIGTMVMLLPGAGRTERAGARAPGDRAAARRRPVSAAPRGLRDRPARARAGADRARPGTADRPRARPDRAPDHLGAAGRGLGRRAAAGPGLRHRGRPDARPAGHHPRQFPDDARHHADLRDRPASHGDRGAARQLPPVPSRRGAGRRRRHACW